MAAQSKNVKSWLSRSACETVQLFGDGRFPNVVVATDGTVLATWGRHVYRVRRSEDGGVTWGEEIAVAEPGFHGGGVTVDERTGSVFAFVEREHPPKTPQTIVGPLGVYRSDDRGRSWAPMNVDIRADSRGHVPARHMAEHGICLQHGAHAGRLLRPVRVYNVPGAEPPRYCGTLYSDDGGVTWTPGAPFPEPGTGEAALVELADGSIYFSARKSWFAGDPASFHHHRYAAWSRDGGETWGEPVTHALVPDGPRYRGEEGRGSNYNGHFGMFAGLTRLPVAGRDILLYSNADTPDHERIHGTVWVSFDGGASWPVKRLVKRGPFAYSSLIAGRPGTASEGWIYLQFEGGEENCYEAGYLARFTLPRLLGGDSTGDGDIPAWVTAWTWGTHCSA